MIDPSRLFPREVLLFIRRSQLEGFICGLGICRKCGVEWPCCIYPECPQNKLECGNCHAQDNDFTEFSKVNRVNRDDDEGEDWKKA